MTVNERPATRLWREAFAQLEELLDQVPAQREHLLAEIGRTQPQLHALLLSLLEAEARADREGFLDTPRMQETALGPGVALGPYRIRSLIGSGGMGDVWLASRDDGLYEGDVAIKTLHPYFGGLLRERFLREAQILGRLTHPNIGRLLDARVADDGGVYLVLEYVRGAAIDTWCDEQRLDIEVRLRLFVDVCAAVSQAHANLVVHRDIKPSNILVTGEGRAKLLDFGIAKLLETEPGAERTELTRISGRIFTPEFAAPEQILGQQITTATDVYSLGVLLHVLLTGQRPFADVNPVAVERAVLHDDAVRTSLAVTDQAGEAAAARSTTPARLRRQIEGDLDNIVARALRKAPAERYASVAALADDVQRHLAHQPILARPESLAARTRKFVRRHRFGVAASLLVVAALGAGVTGVWWQAQVAHREARKATAIKDFVVGIFERNSTSHPDGARARQATAEELLSQASQEIRTGLADAPEVRTELLGMMARLYSNMEMQKDALPLLQDQLETQRRVLGPAHPDAARTLASLAQSQVQSGDYPDAVRSATEAQEIFRANGEESALEYAQTYKILGQANYRLGNYQDGTLLSLYQTGLDLVTKYHPRDAERLSMLSGLSRTEQVLGNHERSLALLQEAAKLAEDGVVELDGIQRGGLYQSLGDRLNWAARNDEAEQFMRKAIVEYEKAGGPEHPYASDGKRALGILLAWSGRREEARELLQEAFESQRRARGDDDPQLTTVIRLDLGRVLLMRGEYLEGEQHLQRVVGIWNTSGQPTLNAKIQLGRLHTEQGRFDLAAQDLEGIDEGAAKMFGPGSWIHATALNRLGALHLAQGRGDEARHYFERTTRETKAVQGLDANLAYARVGLLRLALAEGAPGAAAMAREILSQIEAATTRMEMPDEEAAVHMLLGAVLMRDRQLQEAKSHLEKAVEMRARMDAPDSAQLAEARLYLAQQRFRAGAREEARGLIAQAARALAVQPVGPQFQNLLTETRRRTHLDI